MGPLTTPAGRAAPHPATPHRWALSARDGRRTLMTDTRKPSLVRSAPPSSSPDAKLAEGRTFSHPLNPRSEVTMRSLGDAVGLERLGVHLMRVAPGKESFAYHVHHTEEEFIYACGEAMREEYKAIIDAGLVLQLDDPSIAENWDMINPAPTPAEYRRFSMVRVEALNHALRGLPMDRIRFHLCWGSWHGPHVTDIPMRDIIDVMLAVNAQAYSFEAGNVRHEHEWKVWQDVKLPDGKIVIPGVVSHATNVVEHPEVVADRIARFAALVGRENVIAGTDCGLGGRVHPDIAWAKLQTLAQGAKLATQQLWR